MAPLCTMGKKIPSNENHHQKSSDKPDFSSIINFLGADLRKDKKRRRGDAEKKRRDRINKCLDQLEELIPYVRQKKLCSKVDKAEVLELTVHFVKETLFEKELTYRKTQLSSVVEYERMKWLGSSSEHQSQLSDYDKSPTRKHTKCNCGCSDGLDKRHHLSPDHKLPTTFSSFPLPPPPPLTSSLTTPISSPLTPPMTSPLTSPLTPPLTSSRSPLTLSRSPPMKTALMPPLHRKDY